MSRSQQFTQVSFSPAVFSSVSSVPQPMHRAGALSLFQNQRTVSHIPTDLDANVHHRNAVPAVAT